MSEPPAPPPEPAGFQPFRMTEEQEAYTQEHLTHPSEPGAFWASYFRDQALWLNVPESVVSQQMAQQTITSRQQADVELQKLEAKYNPGFFDYQKHRVQMGQTVRDLQGQRRARPLSKEEEEELQVLSPRAYGHLMGGAKAALGVVATPAGGEEFLPPRHRQELLPRYPEDIPGLGIRQGQLVPYGDPELPENYVLREKGATAVHQKYLAATWMGHTPESIWWNLMEKPPEQAPAAAQEEWRKAQRDLGKRERAAGMHEQWALRTPTGTTPSGETTYDTSRQFEGRHRAGPLARTPEQYTRLRTGYTITGEHYMAGIATLDVPRKSEWWQEQTKEVWLGRDKERSQEVFPKLPGYTWQAGEKRRWIEGGVEETSQFGGKITGVRPTWKTIKDPLTGKPDTEYGYRFTYERIAALQGQMMPKIGDQPGKQVLQYGDLSKVVHADTGDPLNLELVMYGKLASGVASSVFQALPEKAQKGIVSRARKDPRTEEYMRGRKTQDIAYGEIAPTMMDYLSEKMPDWVVPAREKDVEMHRDVLESGVYEHMITGDVRESPLGKEFGIVDLEYPLLVPPEGAAQQIYMEYGVNQPRMNMEMLRQIERVDPKLHARIVKSGSESREAYRRVGRAAMAARDERFLPQEVKTDRGSVPGYISMGREAARQGGSTLLESARARVAELEEQGLTTKEQASAFMRGGAPQAMREQPMLFEDREERAVMPALEDFSVLAASGLFPEESVSKLELMGYNLMTGELRGESGGRHTQNIGKFRQALEEWTSSGEYGREAQSVYLPQSAGEGGDIFGFGAVASFHRKMGDYEAYSPFVEGGYVGNVWGQPVQHGGKHFSTGMDVHWRTEQEMIDRGLDPDVAHVGQQMWQAAARDWDADLMYGLMKARAKWDPEKEVWTKGDGSEFSIEEAKRLGEESLKAGAGDVGADIIQERMSPMQAIEFYQREKMSGFREVSLPEMAGAITERAKVQSHIGPYYMTYRQGMAMSRSERETQAVEAFHQRSHGFAQRPARLPEWAQRFHTAMTWTERSGVFQRYEDKTGAAPGRGIGGLMREMQSALISGYLLPEGTEEERKARREAGPMKAGDISALLTPQNRRGEFTTALRSARAAGTQDEAPLLKRLREMPEDLRTESLAGRWGVGSMIYGMRREPMRDEKTGAFMGYKTRDLPEFTEALRGAGLLPSEGQRDEMSPKEFAKREQAGLMKASELYHLGAIQQAYRRSQAKDLPATPVEGAPERKSAQQVAKALNWAAETGFSGGLVEVAAAAKEFGWALPGGQRSSKQLESPRFPGLRAEGTEGETITLSEPEQLAATMMEEGAFGTGRESVADYEAMRGAVARGWEAQQRNVYPSALNWSSEEQMLAQEVQGTLTAMERGGILGEGEAEQLIPPAGEGGQGTKIHEMMQEEARRGRIKGMKAAPGARGWDVRVDGKWEEQPLRGNFPQGPHIRGRLDVPWGTEFGGRKWGALDVKPVAGLFGKTRTQQEAEIKKQMMSQKELGGYRSQLSVYHWLGREMGLEDLPTGVIPYAKSLRGEPAKATKWMKNVLEKGGPFELTEDMLMSREETIEKIGIYQKAQQEMGQRIQEVAGNIATRVPGFEVPGGMGWRAQIEHFQQYLEPSEMEAFAVAAQELGATPGGIGQVMEQMVEGGLRAAAGESGGDMGGDMGSIISTLFGRGGSGGGGRGQGAEWNADFSNMRRAENVLKQLEHVTGAGVDLEAMAQNVRASQGRPSSAQRAVLSKIQNPLYEAGDIVKGLGWTTTSAGEERLQKMGRSRQDIGEIQDVVQRLQKARTQLWESDLVPATQQRELEHQVRAAAAQGQPFVSEPMMRFLSEKLGAEGLATIPGIMKEGQQVTSGVSTRMGRAMMIDPRFSELERQGWEGKGRLTSLQEYAREKGPGMVLTEAQDLVGKLGKDWTGSKEDFAALGENLKKANGVLGAIGTMDKEDLARKGKAFVEDLGEAQQALKTISKQAAIITPGAREFMAGKGEVSLAELETKAKKGALRPTDIQQLKGLESMAYMGMAPGDEPSDDPRLRRIKGLSDQQRMREAEAAIAGVRMPGQPDRRGFQDMGVAGAAAGTLHRFMSGWELMRLRRMWGLTGQPVFEQFIPAAAQYQMGGWQMATQAAGYGGPPSGAAGGVMAMQAGKQQAMIEAGQAGYDAWGWAMPMMQGFQRGQAAWGPAVGAGLVGGALASTIGMTTGMGAAAAATTIGLPVSLGIAGALGIYGAGQYAMAGVRPTTENMSALYWAQQEGRAGPATRFGIGAGLDWEGLQETRAFLGLEEVGPTRPRPTDAGPMGWVDQLAAGEGINQLRELLGIERVEFTDQGRPEYPPGAEGISEGLESLGLEDTGVGKFLLGLENLAMGAAYPEQREAQERIIAETEREMKAKYEELLVTPLGQMEPRFRAGMLSDLTTRMAEWADTAYPMLSPEQRQAALGQLLPYMEGTSPEEIEKFMKGDYAQRVAVTGQGPEAMRGVAEQFRMGATFRHELDVRFGGLPAKRKERVMTAMSQWSGMQQLGYTAEEIVAGVEAQEMGMTTAQGMREAMRGQGTARFKRLEGQEAIAREEVDAASRMFAQMAGVPLSGDVSRQMEKRLNAFVQAPGGRISIQNAVLAMPAATQLAQATGGDVMQIQQEFERLLAEGQTVRGIQMMSQIGQGQGPLQAAAGIPTGFQTGISRRAYAAMAGGMDVTQMAQWAGAIGFGRTQMGYSMMAQGWGAGAALSGAYAEAGIEGPEAGARGFYEEDFTPIGQRETVAAQRRIQDRQRQYQEFQQGMAWRRLRDPQYGAFAQLERNYAFQMGGYEAGGQATGLRGQAGMHQEMMEFVGTMRDVNNRMRALSRAQQWAGLDAQEAQALLGYRQGRERLGLAQRRFAEDTRHQRAIMGLQAEQMVTTQQWQREDIAWGRETAGLQYEYQMDELGRSIRLSGGRERQQLLRKREYMEEQYGRQETRRNVEAERAEQRMEWERTRFALERQHFEARVQFQEEEFGMQRRHMDENLNMQLGNIGRQKMNLEAMWALEDERQAIQEEWEDRQHEVQGQRIQEQITIAEVNYEQAKQELKWREEELIEAEKYYTFIKGEEDTLRELEDDAREEQRKFTEWLTKQWESGGDLYNAIMELIAAIKGEAYVEEETAADPSWNIGDPSNPKQPKRPPDPVTGDSVLLVVDQQLAFKAHLESVYKGAQQRQTEAGGWGGLWQ